MSMIFIALLIFMFSSPNAAASGVYIEGQDVFNSAAEKMVTGGFSLSTEKILRDGIDIFFLKVRENSAYLVLFLVVGVISSLINLLEFKDKGVREAAFFMCYTVCAGVATEMFSGILEYAVSVTDMMADFITKLAPVMTGLLLTSGKSVSAGIFHPVLATAVFAVTIVVKKLIIPLSVYGAVISIAGNINEQVQISRFCSLTVSLSKWLIAAVFTIFTGVCAIYGFSAPAFDVMSAKTIKFAMGSMVPVVGGFLSDTLETVVSGSRLMKNAVGGAGIFALGTICAIPVIKIGVMLLVLQIAAAATEPITDKRISKLLADVSRAASVIFGMVVTVCVLFIICISIIVGSTG